MMNKNRLSYVLFALIVLSLPIMYFKYIYVSPAEALDNFARVTKEDPLFASEELDGTKLVDSLDYLDSVQGKLMESLNTKDVFTSTAFLRAVVKTKEATETFEKDKTKVNAEKLISSYRDALNKYDKGIIDLGGKVEKYFPKKDGEKNISYLASETSSQTIQADLTLMQKNKEELAKEINNRDGILKGWKRYAPKIYKPSNVTKKTDYKLLSLDQAFTGLKVESKLTDVYQVETSCFPINNDETPFYYSKMEYEGKTIFIPKEARELYYEKFYESSKDAIKFLDNGIPWHRIREGNTYRCNDLEYQPKLLMMQTFLETFKNKVFVDNKFSKEAKDQEELIYSSNVHSYKELDALGDYYAFYYQKDTNKDSSLAKELRSRYLLIKNRESNLDLITNTSLYFNVILDRIKTGVITNIDVLFPYLYVARSNYSLVYLNFSSSVWRIGEKPRYTSYTNKNMEEAQNFKDLTSISKMFSLNKIDSFNSLNEQEIYAE